MLIGQNVLIHIIEQQPYLQCSYNTINTPIGTHSETLLVISPADLCL